MATSDYRAVILERLKARDRQCAQFSRIFASYDALAESFDHLLAKSNKAMAGRKRSTTEGDDESEELESVKIELADVYKKKAINDQQLIDANIKLAELEKKLSIVTEERDHALAKLEELKKKLSEAEKVTNDTLESNQIIRDELLAQQTMYNAIEEKYIVADRERSELINRLKEMKEREIGLVNEFNDHEQHRHLERLRSALEDAAKPNPVLDPKALELVVDDAGSSQAAFGAEHFCDILPERCKIKFECNELGEVNDCVFHPNGKFFFVAGNDKKIKMFEPGSEMCTKRYSLVILEFWYLRNKALVITGYRPVGGE
ncbi:autophagy protein 16 (ATG16) domain-containing protein [Ditylenchus destructor]|uniref:Autophagy protein 16 (ATG16) domain-containing protein n=1 Tax=Ditylenchus destructor TaxID=166010 RepID=A0AAD4NCS6_9BILA|nr:autophagy protein 16 (ATG16) domain-containing protein [Ditylenchus destructor]